MLLYLISGPLTTRLLSLSSVFGDYRLDLGSDEISSVEQAAEVLPAYVGEHDLNVAVQPGLAADIAPISQFMVKIALLELSREGPGLPPSAASGLASLDEDFDNCDYWYYVNRREDVYSRMRPLGEC